MNGLGVMQRALATLVMVLSCLTQTAGAAPDHLLWAALDFPPFQIREGEYRGSGSFDGLLDLLVREMQDVDHEVVTMTFARREEEMRRGTPLCTPGIFRTAAREQYLLFSLPALIHLDNRLVFLQRCIPCAGNGQGVDLEGLLKLTGIVGGIISDRSFAPNVDQALHRQGWSPNIVARPLRSSQILDMLLSGEIDYTILFPHEVAYQLRRFHPGTEVMVRPIVGTPPYILTHVACTRGKQGEAMIARIDRILEEQRHRPEYRALSERWYNDSDRAAIRHYYPHLLASPASGR